MTTAKLTVRVFALHPDRPTPAARRGAVKVWSGEAERRLVDGLRARLADALPAAGLAELRVRCEGDVLQAEPVRKAGSADVDAACLAVANDPHVWPPRPEPITQAEFVVQFEFAP